MSSSSFMRLRLSIELIRQMVSHPNHAILSVDPAYILAIHRHSQRLPQQQQHHHHRPTPVLVAPPMPTMIPMSSKSSRTGISTKSIKTTLSAIVIGSTDSKTIVCHGRNGRIRPATITRPHTNVVVQVEMPIGTFERLYHSNSNRRSAIPCPTSNGRHVRNFIRHNL